MSYPVKVLTVVLFAIAASLYFWFLKQLSWQFHIGLVVGAVVTEMYYWKVTRAIKPGIND
jgi:hypothetical protein